MEKVLDIKQKKKLNIVLPKRQKIGEVSLTKYKCAILIHLHYSDRVNQFRNYLNNIPDNVDVYFTYSDKRVKEQLEVMKYRNNWKFIEKENRGRDISSLLVSVREALLEYDYICFIHDKKEKCRERVIDNTQWLYTMWENILGSEHYIENIIFTLQVNKNIGLLTVPLVISPHSQQIYTNQWASNFKITQDLLIQLGVNANLDINKTPITIGTVFWAKKDALKKLLEKEWKYEDFPEEPLPDDGTISHAVERSLAYVAQDAGYDTGWVMTDEFAAEYIDLMLETLTKSFRILDKAVGINYIFELDSYEEDQKKLIEFIRENRKTYIYGAGKYGISCYTRLQLTQQKIDGFIVTEKNENVKQCCGLPIYVYQECDFSEDDGIIVAVSYLYENDVMNYLNQNFRGKVIVYRKA